MITIRNALEYCSHRQNSYMYTVSLAGFQALLIQLASYLVLAIDCYWQFLSMNESLSYCIPLIM